MLISSQEAHMCAYTECTHHKQHQPSPAFYLLYLGFCTQHTFRLADIFVHILMHCFSPLFFPLEKMHNQIKKHLVTQENQGPPTQPKLMESLICLANKTNDFCTKSLWASLRACSRGNGEGASFLLANNLIIFKALTVPFIIIMHIIDFTDYVFHGIYQSLGTIFTSFVVFYDYLALDSHNR